MIFVEGTPHNDPVPKEGKFFHCTYNTVWSFNGLLDPNAQDTTGEKYLAGI